jgi:hypothetical protein
MSTDYYRQMSSSNFNIPKRSNSQYTFAKYQRSRGEMGVCTYSGFATDLVYSPKPRDTDPYKEIRRRRSTATNSTRSSSKSSRCEEDEDSLSSGRRNWSSGRRDSMTAEEVNELYRQRDYESRRRDEFRAQASRDAYRPVEDLQDPEAARLEQEKLERKKAAMEACRNYMLSGSSEWSTSQNAAYGRRW